MVLKLGNFVILFWIGRPALRCFAMMRFMSRHVLSPSCHRFLSRAVPSSSLAVKDTLTHRREEYSKKSYFTPISFLRLAIVQHCCPPLSRRAKWGQFRWKTLYGKVLSLCDYNTIKVSVRFFKEEEDKDKRTKRDFLGELLCPLSSSRSSGWRENLF